MVRTVLRREFSPFDRSIDTHVSNLRRKLGPRRTAASASRACAASAISTRCHERPGPQRTLMHRLHVKIFLWFWLGVLVVSAHARLADRVEPLARRGRSAWAEKYTPRAGPVGAAGIADPAARGAGRRSNATSARSRWIRACTNYIFDADGHEVLGRTPAPPVVRLVQSMADWPAGKPRVDPDERIIAERVIDVRGTPHVVVVDWPSPSVLNRSLFEFLSPDIYAAASERRVDRPRSSRCSRWRACSASCWRATSRGRSIACARRRGTSRTSNCRRASTTACCSRKDELADLGRDFDRMAERIEQLVTAQRHLLADVSHALRSPLARLNVALGLARQRNGPPTSEHLDRIETEAERLNKLIGQLLTMARVESGVDLERPTRVRSRQRRRRSQHRRGLRSAQSPMRGRVQSAGARAWSRARGRCCAARSRTSSATPCGTPPSADARRGLAGSASGDGTARGRSSRCATTARACRKGPSRRCSRPFNRVLTDGLSESGADRAGAGDHAADLRGPRRQRLRRQRRRTAASSSRWNCRCAARPRRRFRSRVTRSVLPPPRLPPGQRESFAIASRVLHLAADDRVENLARTESDPRAPSSGPSRRP